MEMKKDQLDFEEMWITGISLSIVLGIPATITLRPRRLISCKMTVWILISLTEDKYPYINLSIENNQNKDHITSQNQMLWSIR